MIGIEVLKELDSDVKLSVIICTVPERIQYLQSLIANILKQSYKPYEVLIVTDAGKSSKIRDAIPDHISSILNIRVIESNGVGLSKARNRGVEASSGDIILFIDDDVVIPDRDALFKVVDAFNDSRIGVYGVQVKPLFYNSVRLGDKYNWIFGCTDDGAVRPVGAFFAVRRVCFNVVGLFNERIGRIGGNLLSGEETELFNRIRKYMGLDVVIDRDAVVYHIINNRGWRYVLKRAFMEGVSKSRFEDYDHSVEKKYLKRYLKDFPLGWIISAVTALGYLCGVIGNMLRR